LHLLSNKSSPVGALNVMFIQISLQDFYGILYNFSFDVLYRYVI
jgi:hypothetical protein